MSTIADVFAPVEARKRAIVMHETWGHLDAPRGTRHKGYVLFALGCYGDICILDWRFNGVVANPWIYEELYEFAGRHAEKAKREWGVYHFYGDYVVYKNGRARFVGKTHLNAALAKVAP